MTELTEKNQSYLESFERLKSRWSENGGVWAPSLRQRAIARFAELGFPTTRQEEWKYTSLKAFNKHAFEPASPDNRAKVTASDIAGLTFDSQALQRLVFVDGFYAPELSTLEALPDGVEVGSLSALMHSSRVSEIEEILGARVSFDDHTFVAMNTAFMTDGVFVRVPDGKVVQTPIHLLFVASGKQRSAMASPRVVVVVGKNAEVTLVEDYAALGETAAGDNAQFTNSVSEMTLAENAHVDHYKIVREGPASYHIASLAAHQERSSVLRSHAISLGGQLVRNDASTSLRGTACSATLNGLVVASGSQLIDNHTRISHDQPHCESHELYKHIIDERARGVFNGKIYVAQDAQKTDAKQSNQSLVLSDEASMNTKPELEIYADDVKCTHGATIGQLDADALFYLRTRGLDREEAQSVLTFAFAREVVDGIRVEAVRSTIQRLVFDKLPREVELGEPV